MNNERDIMMNTFKSWHRAVLTVGGVLLLSNGILYAAGSKVQEETRQVFPLKPDGTLSLYNVNGGVEISTWDRDEVELVVNKVAKTKEDLDVVTIEIDNQPSRLTVQTKYPDAKGFKKKGNSTEVFYKVVVPKTANLQDIADVNGYVKIAGVEGHIKASTVNGGIEAKNLVGDVHLSSVNGAVTAGFKRLNSGTVNLGTVNGGIHAELPEAANATISVSTVNGRISGNAFAITGSRAGGKQSNAVLGKGEAGVTANTVNGGIQFSLTKPAS
jgi:hypothetical protein